MIKLEDITKIYGKGSNAFEALDDINLEIKEGEYVAIVGPSGSGKSTLMNILGALDTPTAGKYLLDGEDVGSMKDKKLAEFRNRSVGFIFQRFNLLNQETVLDNVMLPGRYAEQKGTKETAMKRIDQVGLKGKEKNKGNELSGGQMQRVAIARALSMEPRIIMADEPTGNLDSKTGKEIMSLLDKIHNEGNTVILVTHDSYVANHADRIITIMDGKITSDEARTEHTVIDEDNTNL